MSDNIDKILEKIFDVNESDDETTRSRLDAREFGVSANAKTDEQKKEDAYNDWLKNQPKGRAIGLHKNKKR